MMHQNVTSIENYHFVTNFCVHHHYNHHTQRNLPWNVFIINIQATFLFQSLTLHHHTFINTEQDHLHSLPTSYPPHLSHHKREHRRKSCKCRFHHKIRKFIKNTTYILVQISLPLLQHAYRHEHDFITRYLKQQCSFA